MPNRHRSFDTARVIAAFAVVWLHVAAGVVATRPDLHSSAWWTGNVADAFSRWCVPVFVMLSGAVLLSPAATAATPWAFHARRMGRLLPALVAWSAVYLVFRVLTEDGFRQEDVWRSLRQGVPFFHLWYLYMAVGLAVAAPFLQPLVATATPGALRWMTAVCFGLAVAEKVVSLATAADPAQANFLTLFLPFLGYFLAGACMAGPRSALPADNGPGAESGAGSGLSGTGTGTGTATDGERRNRRKLATACACGLAIALATGALLPVIGPHAWRLMYDYLNPLVVVQSLCVFGWLTGLRRPLPGPLLRLAPVTLGIYAVHPLWLWALGRAGMDGLLLHSVVGIPLTTLLAFRLAAASALGLARVPGLRRTVC